MRCEFEEKEYEQPLNYELGKQNVWSPGQVFESIVGFDAAIISNNPEFWKLWQTRGLSLGRQGIHLDWQIWEMVEERWKSKTFPKLKFNLFVQHKVACMHAAVTKDILEEYSTKNPQPETAPNKTRARRYLKLHARASAKSYF